VDSFDDVPILVQNLSQARHLHLEIFLRHYRVGPDPAHDLMFCDEGAGRPDQRHKKIEGAAAELYGLSVDQQPAGARQYAKSTEPNDRVAARAYLVLAGARRIPAVHRLVRELFRDQ
jgi:hypothetical protein